MYTFQFVIEGLIEWLSTKFNDPKAPFVKLTAAPNPATTSFMGNLKGLEIQEGGFTVILLDLNFLLVIRTLGLQQWLSTCEVFYTSYFVEGRRVLEFRIERADLIGYTTVAYGIDNQPAPISEPEVVAE